MFKVMKPGNQYFVINIDEPYARDIYEVLKKGQMEKGEWPEGDITFEEWVEETFKKKSFLQIIEEGLGHKPNVEADCPWEPKFSWYFEQAGYIQPECLICNGGKGIRPDCYICWAQLGTRVGEVEEDE